MLLPAPAIFAQSGDMVEPSAAQLELNNQGVRAIGARKFAEAVKLYQASLALGELNITYVNMGRAYQYMNLCAEAEEAYANALRAPKVAEPAPAQIAAAIERYRDELDAKCVQASAPGAVEGDSEEAPAETDERADVQPAVREVTPPPSETEPTQKARDNSGVYWMAGGGASVLTGAALDIFPAYADDGVLEPIDFVPVGFYVLGVGALVYGIMAIMD